MKNADVSTLELRHFREMLSLWEPWESQDRTFCSADAFWWDGRSPAGWKWLFFFTTSFLFLYASVVGFCLLLLLLLNTCIEWSYVTCTYTSLYVVGSEWPWRYFAWFCFSDNSPISTLTTGSKEWFSTYCFEAIYEESVWKRDWLSLFSGLVHSFLTILRRVVETYPLEIISLSFPHLSISYS